MSPVVVVLTICLMVISCILIAIILFQSGRDASMSSAITGNSSNFYGKNKSATREVFLKRATVISAIIFVLIILVVNIYEIM